MFSWFERLVNPFPDTPPEQPPSSFFAFIWLATKGIRGLILLLAILTAFIGAFEALLFAFLGNIVDWLSVIPAHELWAKEKNSLLLLASVLIASPLLIALQALVKYQTLNGNFAMRLRWNFHRQLLSQSMSFFQDEFAGRVSTKMMQTSLAVRDTIMIITDILVFIVIYFITMTAIVGSFNLELLIPFLAWVALYILALYYFVPRLGKAASAQADARSLMSGRVTDAYSNISTVKLFSHNQREALFAKQAMTEFLGTVYRQMRLITGFEVINHILSMGLILSTAGATLWLWSLGEVGIGAVAAATAMALRLNGVSHWIMWEMSNLFEHIGTVHDGMSMLSKTVDIQDTENAKPLVIKHGEIRIENLSFAYSPNHTVINEFSLTIKPGEKIGLIGRSGAGKSTIVNLLLRFYPITQGNIFFDGQAINDVTQESLRKNIGMVTQDTSLLHRSVRDNLLYGNPDATEQDMEKAVIAAEAEEFIQQLRDSMGRTGFDAHVGERGVKLSGGQRQRVAIARVMLKNAPILLLDEATSALDSEVETIIQRSLYRLMEGKTVVAIAHRLSTIAAMDRLIVLDKGQIVEQGTHTELLSRGGLYSRLWAHQSGGFLIDED